LNRGLAFLALAGLAALPRALNSQGVPEALKGDALAVRVFAVVPTPPATTLQGITGPAPGNEAPEAEGQSASATKEKGPGWQAERVKYTVPGSPVPFKFVGDNVVVLVQVTPFGRQDGQGLVLVTQGQVWIKSKEGGISYHTTINTLSVNYGEKVFFFPLGVDSEGKTPLRLEIAVLHAADLANPSDGTPEAAEDKSGTGDKPNK
jgi:hypothetical protein